jgi:DNA-binding NarL/FixJ family response regulator
MLSDFLSSLRSVVVVGEATDGIDAVRKADELTPDLVLMDLAMPGMSGFDATKAIKVKHPKTRVVVLSSHVGEVYRKAALEHLADGYIEKNSMKSGLQAVLERYPDNEVRMAV